jgi:tetratricopeptide (TPR) repeat protein
MFIVRNILVILIIILSGSNVNLYAQEVIDNREEKIKKPLYKPFIERYVLDELKQLRQDQSTLRVEVAEKVANAKLDSSDRVIRYTADTTNIIFYIITAAASILVFLGWKSLRDIKDKIEFITTEKLSILTQEYESRLDELENKLKNRSEQIIATQEEVSSSNTIHSLWMRAGLEKSDQEKLNIYDHILEINPDDTEALTYKADVLLDLGEIKWALSLSNQAIENDSNYALAYWQRACAKAMLEQESEALEDIKMAIKLTGSLKDEIVDEIYFEKLKSNHDFLSLMEETDSMA